MGSTLQTGQADDLLVDLAATPNRPGQNFVTATLLDTQRPSPGAPQRVSMTFVRGPERVTARATRLDANRWQVAGTQLTAPGSWRIAVAVERKGLPRATYATGWTVASPLPAPGAHRARYSQRPLQPILSALALALAALSGSALLWRGRRRTGLRRPRIA